MAKLIIKTIMQALG